MTKRILFSFIFSFLALLAFSQNITFEGYIYESGNRGYLNTARVQILDSKTEVQVVELFSNIDGFVSCTLIAGNSYVVKVSKDMFHPQEFELDLTGKKGTDKSFLKMEMKRAPGYQFEITMAEKRSSPDEVVDAIKNTRIEVYNNTTRKEILNHQNYENPDFKVNLLKGNHYTIMIRKKGFLAKRMEAFVDVEGCILCFEGIGSVSPGVADNLTENNAMGVLLANVELERIYAGKTMEINNLYYDLGKHYLKSDAKKELNKVITLINDNPDINLELGSHTDARGTSESNMTLSQKRAKSAVRYLVDRGNIDESRLSSRGYGESLITNECRDGVKCSEEDHAVNRRTELKITGTFESDKPFVPLVKMKQEEFMEELISELSNQEQVVVQGDEEAGFLNDKKSIDEEIIDNDIVEKKKLKDEISKASPNLNIVQESTPSDIIEDKLSKLEQTAVEETIKKEVIEEKSKTVDLDLSGFKKSDTIDNMVISNPTEEVPVNMGLTGSKIVIKKSEKALAKDDEIFTKHNNVIEYFNEDGNVYYLVGEFQSKEEAESFLKQVLKFVYPDAYVVELVNGKIQD